MILSPAVKKAFDLSQESEKTKDTYGRHGSGQSVLLARRLVEGGCRFVTAAGYKFSEWDTHSQNAKNHRDKLVPPLDQALSALLEDLEQRGLLESTVVIAMGEFGRTPHINPAVPSINESARLATAPTARAPRTASRSVVWRGGSRPTPCGPQSPTAADGCRHCLI